MLSDMDYQNGNVMIGKQAFQLDQMWIRQIDQSGVNQFAFGIRPEHLEIFKTPEEHSFRGTVKYVENQGSDYCVYVNLEDKIKLLALSEIKNGIKGEVVYIRPMMNHIHIFDQETTNSIGYPKVLDQ